MKKTNLFLKIISACALIITFSIFYYLVIFLPAFQNKKLELSKTVYKDENFINDSWIKKEYTKDLNGDGINEWIVIDGPHGSGEFSSFDLFSMINNEPEKVFSSEVFYQGVIKIINDKIVVSFGFPKERDPNCCPSRTKIRNYIYKNEEVSLESEKVIENKRL